MGIFYLRRHNWLNTSLHCDNYKTFIYLFPIHCTWTYYHHYVFVQNMVCLLRSESTIQHYHWQICTILSLFTINVCISIKLWIFLQLWGEIVHYKLTTFDTDDTDKSSFLKGREDTKDSGMKVDSVVYLITTPAPNKHNSSSYGLAVYWTGNFLKLDCIIFSSCDISG